MALVDYLLKWTKDLYSHKNLPIYIYSHFIHDRQNLEAPKMFRSRWMEWINFATFRQWDIIQY